MKIGPHLIGVCSWSLKPSDMRDLVSKVRATGLEHVQLAIEPLLNITGVKREQELAVWRESGLSLTAGMIAFPGEDYSTMATIHATGGLRPDDRWEQNLALVQNAAQLARELGLSRVTFHCGFIPETTDMMYAVMVERTARVADVFAVHQITALMETGQEDAWTLNQFLDDVGRKNLGVNFDPANMLLYASGDPMEAIEILAGRIQHVHVKDAIVSDHPGETWGREVPFGTGEVGASAFLLALQRVGYRGPLCIEREAGDDRIKDVKTAIAALQETDTGSL